jgi:hypothetical protein
MDAVKPNKNDVKLGRGNGISSWSGNVNFREIIEEHRPEYSETRKNQKWRIAERIFNLIASLEPEGRFIKLDDESNTYHVVDYTTASEKICQALREKTKWKRKMHESSDDESSNDDDGSNTECTLPQRPPKKRYVQKKPKAKIRTSSRSSTSRHLNTKKNHTKKATIDFQKGKTRSPYVEQDYGRRLFNNPVTPKDSIKRKEGSKRIEMRNIKDSFKTPTPRRLIQKISPIASAKARSAVQEQVTDASRSSSGRAHRYGYMNYKKHQPSVSRTPLKSHPSQPKHEAKSYGGVPSHSLASTPSSRSDNLVDIDLSFHSENVSPLQDFHRTKFAVLEEQENQPTCSLANLAILGHVAEQATPAPYPKKQRRLLPESSVESSSEEIQPMTEINNETENTQSKSNTDNMSCRERMPLRPIDYNDSNRDYSPYAGCKRNDADPYRPIQFQEVVPASQSPNRTRRIDHSPEVSVRNLTYKASFPLLSASDSTVSSLI